MIKMQDAHLKQTHTHTHSSALFTVAYPGAILQK